MLAIKPCQFHASSINFMLPTHQNTDPYPVTPESSINFSVLIEKGVQAFAESTVAALRSSVLPNRIGELALRKQMLTIEQLSRVLKEQSLVKHPLGEVAIGLGLLTRRQVHELLSVQAQERERLVGLILQAMAKFASGSSDVPTP